MANDKHMLYPTDPGARRSIAPLASILVRPADPAERERWRKVFDEIAALPRDDRDVILIDSAQSDG
jgi:hypothetical protein